MRNFSYCNPTRILFGAGQIASLGQLIPADSRVLVGVEPTNEEWVAARDTCALLATCTAA